MLLLGGSFCLYESANFHSQQVETPTFAKTRCTYFWIFSHLKIRIQQWWLKNYMINNSFYWIYYRWRSQRMKFVFNGGLLVPLLSRSRLISALESTGHLYNLTFKGLLILEQGQLASIHLKQFTNLRNNFISAWNKAYCFNFDWKNLALHFSCKSNLPSTPAH